MKTVNELQLTAYKAKRAGWWLLNAYTLDGENEYLWYKSEEAATAELAQLALAHIRLTDEEGYESETLDGFAGAEVRAAERLTSLEWIELLDGEQTRQVCIELAKARSVSKRAGTSKRRRKR